jgi:TPR repeat protein
VENEVPQAITNLGQAYRDGCYGLAKNMRKSAKIFKRAVEHGDVVARLHLAMMYFEGQGVKKDVNKAKQLLRSGMDRGYVPAQAMLGIIMVSEIDAGIHEDHEGTLRMLNSAADRGHSGSQYQLGQCYELGIAVEADLDEAKRWYARAAGGSSLLFQQRSKAGLARLAQSDP